MRIRITVYLRTLKEGRFWYASWRASDPGSLVYKKKTVPTDVPERPHVKDRGKAEALQEASLLREKWLKEEEIRETTQVPTYREFAKGFYAPGSPYLKRQATKGKPLSKIWAQKLNTSVNKHLIPAWGDKRLDEFDPVSIENWAAELPLSSGTKRQIIYGGLRTVFKEAKRNRIIRDNPLSELEPPIKQSRRRDVFTLDELKKLFPPDEKELIRIWGSFKIATMFATIAYTAIRTGEARALQWTDVQGGFLLVQRAVKMGGEIGALKKRERSGEPRPVLLLPNVARALEQLRNLNGSSIWMFPSDRTSKPYSRLFFVYALRRACERAEIKIEGRFIDCHSFRHTFNTVIKPVVAQNITQALLGHKSPMMTDLYDHPSLESKMKQLEAVKDVIAAAFDVK